MAAPDAFLLASVFGILGNIVAFMVYLAPLPTFYRIFKKKSTEGFQSIPYSVALFSAMLMLYYAFLKTNAFMLITINSVGCIIETSFLVMYIIYAPAKTRIYTAKLLVLFNAGVYGVIILSTYLIPNHFLRIKVVGWISVVFSVCVFAAPLSIMRLVIRTRSVEFMSFPLSFCLTLCAVMWFFYGLLVRDLFIAAPNILGFAFGLAQMIMYLMFKNSKKSILPEFSLNQIPNVVAVNDIVASDSQLKTKDTKKSSEAEENQSTESMTNDSRAGDAAAAEPNESIV